MSASRHGGQRRKGRLTVADGVFIAFLFVIITMMVIPVPVVLTDALIFVSLSFSVLILMMTLYVDRPTSFSSFPVLLLTLAVYRIALSVATTRNILVHGESGKIIAAFGEVAIAGNVLVGFVIFLIITIVQFVVINKGAERVAEVGARFTLDAMPGKQMSIDADLRAGAMDFNVASSRRAEVQREAEFNGAMDGSMKFLKGDAIAGVMIILVNFIGGLAIGVGQHGLPFGEALQTYSVLTIGDGLVAQIPSIFTAIGSGVLVTRIAHTDGPEKGLVSLAGMIAGQIQQYPLALLASAVVVGGIALFPGFPTLLVITFAVFLASAWWFLSKKETAAIEEERSSFELPATKADHDDDQRTRFVLLIAEENTLKGGTEAAVDEMRRAAIAMRERWNVPVPMIEVELTDQLPDDAYLFLEDDEPLIGGQCRGDRVIGRNIGWALALADVEATCFTHEGQSIKAFAIDQTDRPKVEAFGAQCLEAEAYLASRLTEVVQARIGRYLTLGFASSLLATFVSTDRYAGPELQKTLSNVKVFEILRECLNDGVPLTNYLKVLRLIQGASLYSQDIADIVEHVRQGMRAEIIRLHLADDAHLYYLGIDQAFAEEVAEYAVVTPLGERLNLPAGVSDRLVSFIERATIAWKFSEIPLVLSVPDGLRSAIRAFLMTRDITIPVVGEKDLAPAANPKCFDTLSASENVAAEEDME